MICPYCRHPDTKVMDKRESDVLSTRRRRECLTCHERFTTYERIEPVELMVAKHDGRREPFNPEKIRAGILLAVKKRPVAREQVDVIVELIETELRECKAREVSSETVGGLVMKHLKELDPVAYIRFASVYRDFGDAASFQREAAELLD